MVGDMIVNLYRKKLWRENNDIDIRRIFPSDKERLLNFMKINFPNEKGWRMEAECALQSNNIFVAVDNHNIMGFACYDCTGKGYFGPFGVAKEFRGKGIGTELFYSCLDAMKSDGYGYAVLGWIADKEDDDNSPLEFYIKTSEAVYIPNSEPCNTLYSRKVTL